MVNPVHVGSDKNGPDAGLQVCRQAHIHMLKLPRRQNRHLGNDEPHWGDAKGDNAHGFDAHRDQHFS